MSFHIVNISDLIYSVNESEVTSALSEFECAKNPEIEHFLKTNAIDFAKRKISAFLIALFGKNSAYGDSENISGNKMMDFCFEILASVQKEVGGGIVFLECEDKKPLLNFYQNENNNFRIYGERISESDKTKYVQLLKFF